MSRSRTYNCPNCGAPIERSSYKCPYCGTEYEWVPMITITTHTANVQTLRGNASVSDDVIRFLNDKKHLLGHVGDVIIDSMRPELKKILKIKEERDPYMGYTRFFADLKVILPIEDFF